MILWSPLLSGNKAYIDNHSLISHYSVRILLMLCQQEQWEDLNPCWSCLYWIIAVFHWPGLLGKWVLRSILSKQKKKAYSHESPGFQTQPFFPPLCSSNSFSPVNKNNHPSGTMISYPFCWSSGMRNSKTWQGSLSFQFILVDISFLWVLEFPKTEAKVTKMGNKNPSVGLLHLSSQTYAFWPWGKWYLLASV